MKIICRAKIGLMPNTASKGYYSLYPEIDNISQAESVYYSWLEQLDDKYNDFFVTGLGWIEFKP